MEIKTILKKFLNIIRFFQLFKNYIDGDYSYKIYLIHHEKNHQQNQPLTRKEFLQKKQYDKWQKVNRCC